MLALPALYENELASVRTTFDEELRTSTATLARVESAKETDVDSPMPSPFGVTTCGRAVRLVTSSGGGPGTVPRAGRRSGPASIAYEKSPNGVAEASHVQSTAVPVPLPVATTASSASRIVTVQGSASVSVAVNRTWPPRLPPTTGL